MGLFDLLAAQYLKKHVSDLELQNCKMFYYKDHEIFLLQIAVKGTACSS